MSKASFEELLDAGVHFGHLKRKWNPNMAPYIFTEKKGIHIIDLHKTAAKLDEACTALQNIARSGKKVMFVATKKQAKGIVAEHVDKINMPYVTERWSGGMLTNFATIRKSIRKMGQIDKMKGDGTWDTLSKREKLFKERQRTKLQKNLGTIAEMTRLPAAVFVVDINKEHIAVAEAIKLGIPVFGMVDTNSDPTLCQFPIPSNDDASKSIAKIMGHVCDAITGGLDERRVEREKRAADEKPAAKEEAAKPTEEEKPKAKAKAKSEAKPEAKS